MKRLTILGSGESGTGAALLAQKMSYAVFVSDKGEIKEQYKNELKTAQIPFEEGKHDLKKILRSKLIIKSPGIPETAEIIVAANQKGIEIIGEIEFASRFFKGKIAAITGSNGKTTTTNLVYHLLKTAKIPAFEGGNVGKSFARIVAENGPMPEQIAVLEMSSFQLDDCRKFRPDVAILLNITPDHLDRYGYKIENYVASKFRIAMNQKRSNSLIINGLDENISTFLASQKPKSKLLKIEKGFFKKGKIQLGRGVEFDLSKTNLAGRHNAFNAAAAARAAMILGAKTEQIEAAFASFRLPPHRMESCGDVGGVRYINDSKATNVDSVFYALDAMTTKVIWIVGGVDKGNDYSPLFESVRKKVRVIICLGTDNNKLIEVFSPFNKRMIEARSMKDALSAAQKNARKGETVLLSPACASFDLFKNYEDRGNQFKMIVSILDK